MLLAHSNQCMRLFVEVARRTLRITCVSPCVVCQLKPPMNILLKGEKESQIRHLKRY